MLRQFNSPLLLCPFLFQLSYFLISFQESQASTEEEAISRVTVGQDRPADGEPSANGGEYWVCPDRDEGGRRAEDREPVSGGDAQDHVHWGCGEDHGRDTGRHWVPEGKLRQWLYRCACVCICVPYSCEKGPMGGTLYLGLGTRTLCYALIPNTKPIMLIILYLLCSQLIVFCRLIHDNSLGNLLFMIALFN